MLIFLLIWWQFFTFEKIEFLENFEFLSFLKIAKDLVVLV